MTPAEAYLAELRRPGETILQCEDRRDREKADLWAAAVIPLPMLVTVCAWCKAPMERIAVPPGDPSAGKVSHGICPECAAKYFPDCTAYPKT